MTHLFFDTETTGLPDFKAPPSAATQPHICQLGAILTDDLGNVKAEANFMVAPDGWEIPAQATEIHGISQADALQYGLSIKGIMSIFSRLATKSTVIIAHNIKFDLLMLAIERVRLGIDLELPRVGFCTMQKSTDIVKIPPTAKMKACGMDSYKNPSLKEAYRHFFGEDFEGAHDAMADVRACKDVFFELKKLEKERIPA